MNKTFMKMDKILLVVTAIFFIFGLIMVLSASSMESYMSYDNSPYYYFYRQLIFLIAGSIVFLFVINMPTKNYRHLSKFLIIGIVALLVGLTIYGNVANNAKSWFDLGFFSVQPSEIAKLCIIIYLAMYYEQNKEHFDKPWILLLPLILCLFIVSLVAIQPDFGTAGIIGLLSLMMFYAVPMQKKHRSIINKLIIGSILVVGAILVVTGGSILRDYQLERFNFLNPCDRYEEDSGYQLCNSFIAFNNGGVTGQGIGESTQKFLYLPESYTDFIFPIIVEEWGMIVGILVIIGYALILFRIFKVAHNANCLHNSLLAYGVFCYIFLHIIINLCGVMGLAPLTGVPLPFLSYGGSYTLCLFVALGLVQRVKIESYNKKLIKKRK